MTADETVTPLDLPSSNPARYELGRLNWASPTEAYHGWVPDLVGGSGKPVRLTENQLIDIVLLGDGYHSKADFENELAAWLGNFFKLDVYNRFCGAFRIQALFTQSDGPCRKGGKSYYGVQVDDAGHISRHPHWWEGDAGKTFRKTLFDAVERFGVSSKRYPADLDVGDPPAVHNRLAGLRSHLIVMMLVKSVDSDGKVVPALGCTRDVRYGQEHDDRVNVGFGHYSLHEFGHALAYLEDEYIRDRGERASRKDPSALSIYSLSNLSFDNRLSTVPPWLHLSPWGTLRRQAAGSAHSPVVGWLWRGGEQEFGVWHSEYKCLMKGRLIGQQDRYCLWCQEIVVTRILEKTGQFARHGDPTQCNELGRIWHSRWVTDLRKKYWDYFDVDTQIRHREADYEGEVVDGAILPVWQSDLYKVFQADSATTLESDDEELSMHELLMITGQ